MNAMIRIVPFVALLALLPLALTSCEENDGPLEKAGEQLDEATKDAKRAIEDATD